LGVWRRRARKTKKKHLAKSPQEGTATKKKEGRERKLLGFGSFQNVWHEHARREAREKKRRVLANKGDENCWGPKRAKERNENEKTKRTRSMRSSRNEVWDARTKLPNSTWRGGNEREGGP